MDKKGQLFLKEANIWEQFLTGLSQEQAFPGTVGSPTICLASWTPCGLLGSDSLCG